MTIAVNEMDDIAKTALHTICATIRTFRLVHRRHKSLTSGRYTIPVSKNLLFLTQYIFFIFLRNRNNNIAQVLHFSASFLIANIVRAIFFKVLQFLKLNYC